MSRLASKHKSPWTVGDVAMAAEAMLLLGVARTSIVLLRFRHIARLFGLVAEGDGDASAGSTPDEAVAAVGRAVARAARRTPWRSACLPQALAGAGMLRRRGIEGVLVLGLDASSAPDRMTAHAWVESHGRVITGAPAAGRHTPVARFGWRARPR